MTHVDALSRCYSINLAIKQSLDQTIAKMANELGARESKLFEMRDGLVYRKDNEKILFYMPPCMEGNVIKIYDDMGHVGTNKAIDLIKRSYWFPDMKAKVSNYISNYVPFSMIHIDHVGPIEKTQFQNKHILVVVDAFTKFVRLYEYACKSTTSKEVIKHLSDYFRAYSKSDKVISDRSTAFTSYEFKEFLEKEGIAYSLIATGVPRANGQVERINRVITPMLAKLSPRPNRWDTVLSEVEFCINNTRSESMGFTPSALLYGLNQKGKPNDSLRLYLESHNLGEQTNRLDLLTVRESAAEKIKKCQEYNETYYDKSHKAPRVHSEGDYVMFRNTDTTSNVNKKLIPKFKGPYIIKNVLPNDRYVLGDVDGFQLTQIPFSTVADPANLKPWPVE